MLREKWQELLRLIRKLENLVDGPIDRGRTKMIDATAQDIVQSLDNLRFRRGA